MVLAGISLSGSKRAKLKLGGCTYAFAEITDEKELGIRSLQGRISVPTGNLHRPRAKVKTGNRGSFDIFLHFYMVVLARLRDREHGIAANPAGFYPYPLVDVDTGSGYMNLIHGLRYSMNHIFQIIDDTNSC